MKKYLNRWTELSIVGSDRPRKRTRLTWLPALPARHSHNNDVTGSVQPIVKAVAADTPHHRVQHITQGFTLQAIGTKLLPLTAAINFLMPLSTSAADLTSPQIVEAPPAERFAIPKQFPPLQAISELPIKEMVLSNGLKVFLIEDHEVPLVKLTLAFRGGQRASPADKVGLASISSAVLRSGGSTNHPGPEMDRILEELAAGIEGTALPEALLIGFQSLKEDTSQVLGLFTELLQSPVLPDSKIRLIKDQIVNYIEHRNDSPRGIPVRELAKLIYGNDSVYARQPSLDQVQSISRADVQAYLDRVLVPGGGILGVLGDFELNSMEAMLEDTIGSWVSKNQSPVPNPTSPIPDRSDSAGQLLLVDFPGATQASVAMGEVGVELSDPDTPSLDVLNEILNSFGGVLFNEIRSKEGLAYSVSGGFNTGAMGHPGLFVATGETAAIGEFINSMERVLKEVTQQPPSPEILEAAKARVLNSFVFNFASSDAQLQRLLGYTLVGLPQDYLFQFRDKIQGVTAEDVLAAARRHLHPSKQDIVVAADASLNLIKLQKQSRPISPLIVTQ